MAEGEIERLRKQMNKLRTNKCIDTQKIIIPLQPNELNVCSNSQEGKKQQQRFHRNYEKRKVNQRNIN